MSLATPRAGEFAAPGRELFADLRVVVEWLEASGHPSALISADQVLGEIVVVAAQLRLPRAEEIPALGFDPQRVEAVVVQGSMTPSLDGIALRVPQHFVLEEGLH